MKDSILVFKTSVSEHSEVRMLQHCLNNLICPGGYWNFDLEDCDNILKLVNPRLPPSGVIRALGKRGYLCEEL